MRHKDSELEIGGQTREISEPRAVEQLPPAKQEPDGLSQTSDELVLGTDLREESRFAGAYDLLMAGNYKEGLKQLHREAESEPDEQKRVAFIAFGQYLAAVKGSPEALVDLRTTAGDHPRLLEPHFWLAFALKELGMLLQARDAADQALGTAASDDDRATMINFIAGLAAASDGTTGAIDFLLREAATIAEQRSKSKVYARAAKLLLELEPPGKDRGFSLYELALALAPYDNSLRFDVAHAYSESDAPAQALIHYGDLVRRDPKHDGAYNNLGVAAEHLDLHSIAVSSYKQAEDLGNTLATANIGWELINAGFVQEARQRLEAKIGEPDVHENVLDALGGVAKRVTADETRRDEITKKAERIRSIRLAIGQALATGQTLDGRIDGEYSDGSAKLQLTMVGPDGVSGELSSLLETRDIGGRMLGTAILFHWETRRPKDVLSSGLGLFSKTKKGHGVLLWSESCLEGYTVEGDSSLDPVRATGWKQWRFTRHA